MEGHSYSVSSSSNNSYLSSLYNPNKPNNPQTIFNSSLHSVRKTPAKPWKKPIAPLPPMLPKIYKVDSANFREVVQRLTGAPPETYQSRRLHSIAPSPIKISSPSSSENQKVPSPVTFGEVMAAETEYLKTWRLPESFPAVGPLGISLSPSSPAWCSLFPMLSPGTLSSLEQSTVL